MAALYNGHSVCLEHQALRFTRLYNRQDFTWDLDPEAVDDIGDIEVPPLPQFSSQRHRLPIEMIMTLVTFRNFTTNIPGCPICVLERG